MPEARPSFAAPASESPRDFPETIRSPWVDTAASYALAIGFVTGAHVLCSGLWSTIGPGAYTAYMLAVVLAALYGGVGPGLLATCLSTADLSYHFMRPLYSFALYVDDVVFLSVFAGMSVLTSSLQGRRRSAEAALRRAHHDLELRVRDRTAELEESRGRLNLLVNDLLVIAEREQLRIGHDLHDGLGQELTGISMLTVALADRLRASASPVAGDAEAIAGLVRQSIAHTRDLARGLCPVDQEHDGIVPALSRLAELVSRFPNVSCGFSSAGDVDTEPAVAIHLYRIAQEAINNALRHGRATEIGVAIHDRSGVLVLSVADNGVGFSPTRAPAGLGLRLMDYRARTIDADLTIRPRPGGGTVVLCSAKSARNQPP